MAVPRLFGESSTLAHQGPGFLGDPAGLCPSPAGWGPWQVVLEALEQMVANEGVQVRMLPDDVVSAMGVAAAEVMDELAQDDDELVRRITESFNAYRNSIGSYMTYADNGQMNARASVLGY